MAGNESNISDCTSMQRSLARTGRGEEMDFTADEFWVRKVKDLQRQEGKARSRYRAMGSVWRHTVYVTADWGNRGNEKYAKWPAKAPMPRQEMQS